MPTTVSLTTREAVHASRTSEVFIALITLTNDEGTVVRMSSDPTERLNDDPLTYGTVSRGDEYLFMVMSAVLPDNQDGVPTAFQIVLENVSRDMAEVARAGTEPATVTLEVVTASSPDTIEDRYVGFVTTEASYNAKQISVSVSRESVVSEPCPAQRMTRDRTPGLFR